MRVGELAGIQIEDLDLEYSVIVVLGKNRRRALSRLVQRASRVRQTPVEREVAYAEGASRSLPLPLSI
jgi:site-specific recombinase XerC